MVRVASQSCNGSHGTDQWNHVRVVLRRISLGEFPENADDNDDVEDDEDIMIDDADATDDGDADGATDALASLVPVPINHFTRPGGAFDCGQSLTAGIRLGQTICLFGKETGGPWCRHIYVRDQSRRQVM